MSERWKPCPGFYKNYEISDLGRLKSKLRRRNGSYIRKPWINKDGYYVLSLNKGERRIAKTIHRLVALAFVPKVKGKMCLNHKDGDKLNNCAENLEWCTPGDNLRHAIGLRLVSFSNKKRKVAQYTIDGRYIRSFDSITNAAKSVNVKESSIRGLLNGEGISIAGFAWKWYTGEKTNIEWRTPTYFKKPVCQYNLEGELLNEFESGRQAEDITGCWHQTIAKCCLGKRAQTGGFIWKYKNTQND